MTNDKFRYLENIATADLAFEAFGKDYSELFENAALALESSMVELSSLGSTISKNVRLESENLDGLLFIFLEELVFLKDAEQLLFNQIKCEAEKGVRGWRLEASLTGEKIDRARHKFGTDVKAVTKHLFKVEKLRNKTYHCLVVLDI